MSLQELREQIAEAIGDDLDYVPTDPLDLLHLLVEIDGGSIRVCWQTLPLSIRELAETATI